MGVLCMQEKEIQQGKTKSKLKLALSQLDVVKSSACDYNISRIILYVPFKILKAYRPKAWYDKVSDKQLSHKARWQLPTCMYVVIISWFMFT